MNGKVDLFVGQIPERYYFIIIQITNVFNPEWQISQAGYLFVKVYLFSRYSKNTGGIYDYETQKQH